MAKGVAGIQVVDVVACTEAAPLVVEVCLAFDNGVECGVDGNVSRWWWAAGLPEVVGGGVGTVNEAGKLGQGGGFGG